MGNIDPWEVLGLDRDAGPREIRARYLELVRSHPPESDGPAFSRIREAYEILVDPLRKVRAFYLEPDPLKDPGELEILLLREGRRPAGAEAWIDALRSLDKDRAQEKQQRSKKSKKSKKSKESKKSQERR